MPRRCDTKAACTIYSKLLGWQFMDRDVGTGTYTAVNGGGGASAALLLRAP